MTVFWVILGGLVASTLLPIVIGVGLTRTIARPVAQMTEAMRKLSSGNKAIDIPAIGQKDVEAARAGESGRGFAVVASEVRALAQRSAEAAKEIKGLITTSAGHVETGVERINNAGEAIARIVSQVTEINTLVAEIAASAKEQSAGLSEVNASINQMDQVTQQNAAIVEETTAASRSLAEEADDLARLVGQFNVGAARTGLRRAA